MAPCVWVSAAQWLLAVVSSVARCYTTQLYWLCVVFVRCRLLFEYRRQNELSVTWKGRCIYSTKCLCEIQSGTFTCSP